MFQYEANVGVEEVIKNCYNTVIECPSWQAHISFNDVFSAQHFMPLVCSTSTGEAGAANPSL